MNTPTPEHSPYEVKLFIDGAWRDAAEGASRAIIDPASGATIGQLAHASGADLDAALAAAARGFELWSRQSAKARGAVLLQAAQLIRARSKAIARLVSLENGKLLAEAEQELNNCADSFEWCAEEARRLYGRAIPARAAGISQNVTHEPIGPVAAFSPWNFPASQAAKKLAAALAVGCSIILKGPEEAPSGSAALLQALADAGLPAGVANLVFGEPAAISKHLIAAPVIRKISFTGSVPVGKLLAQQAAAYMKPCTLELGGHAPVLVFDDVDPVGVAHKLAQAKFRNAGQVCISPTRFYVQAAIYDDFAAALAEAAAALKLGRGDQPGVQMGPLIQERRRSALHELITDAIEHGARVLTGAAAIPGAGFFYRPTVLDQIPEQARIWHEEPFGPVALLRPFETLEQGIALANSTSFGLAAYVFTNSAALASQASAQIESGLLGINHFALGLAEAPFGGIKESGYGREGGTEGLQAYTTTKFITRLEAVV